MQQVIIGDEINDQAEYRYSATAGKIPESL